MDDRELRAERLVRWRYPLLLMWAAPWLVWGWFLHEPHNDWFYAEIGVRTLVRHHLTVVSGPLLHVYVTNPEVQMGPPSLLVLGPSQWLPEQLGLHLCALVVALLVFPSLWCLERAAGHLVPVRSLGPRVLLSGAVVVPTWVCLVEVWGHVDDAVGLLAMAVTCLLVSTGRREIVAGLVLGTGAAAKPWMVLLLPLLLAYPRPRIPRAVLSFIVGALAWWLPFVLGDPGTIHALGSFRLGVGAQATWSLLGMAGHAAPAWIRPLQLLVGLVLATAVLRRAGWAAVPAAVLAWRVTTDPYSWPYYAMGPLLGCFLWDLTRRAERPAAVLPWATLSAFAAEFLVERDLSAAVPVLRIAWCLGLVSWLLVGGRSRGLPPAEHAADPAGLPADQLVAAVD